MKSKITVLAIIIILFLSVSYIFIAGNLKYQKASEGIVNFGFAGSGQSLSIPDFGILDTTIENRNPDETVFTLHYAINNTEITTKEFSIAKNTRQIIAAPEEVKSYITANQKNLGNFRYEIKATWNDKEEDLYKSITIN